MTNNKNIKFTDFENEARELLASKDTYGSKIRGQVTEQDWDDACQDDSFMYASDSIENSHDFN